MYRVIKFVSSLTAGIADFESEELARLDVASHLKVDVNLLFLYIIRAGMDVTTYGVKDELFSASVFYLKKLS